MATVPEGGSFSEVSGPPKAVLTAVLEGWPLGGIECEIEPGQMTLEWSRLDTEGIPPEWPESEPVVYRYAGRLDREGRAVFRLFHWSNVKPDEVVDVKLSGDERDLLWEGLHQWGGPTSPTDAVARVIGFADVETMHTEGERIRQLLRDGRSLTKRDWQRALIATEIVWASSFYGAASDWEIVAAGWDDQRTLQVLRQLQGRFLGLGPPPRRRRGA
jgi:hypothetical protein